MSGVKGKSYNRDLYYGRIIGVCIKSKGAPEILIKHSIQSLIYLFQ